MTPRQLTVVRAIQDYCDEHGYSPTLQEVADTLGLTKVTVHEHVGVLVKRGVLARQWHMARSLHVLVRVEGSLKERVTQEIEKALEMLKYSGTTHAVTAHLQRMLEDL